MNEATTILTVIVLTLVMVALIIGARRNDHKP